MHKKRILVGMSGGVDSSVAAALLVAEGHEVIGIHLQFWSEDVRPGKETKLPENKCCSLDALENARATAGMLGIPFYTLNFREVFKKNVVDYFIDEAEKGNTPNPCVMCNRTIKFGHLLQKMRDLDCTHVASGHYAQNIEHNGMHELHRAVDSNKDQTYFMYHLTQEKLRHIIFPLGGMTKDEVRSRALDFKLCREAAKKESQGVCFFPEEGPQGFLMRNLSQKYLQAGPMIDVVTGKELGRHKGLPLYTIGQRRGVDIGGTSERYFVAGFDREYNALLVGPEAVTKAKTVSVKQISFINEKPENGSTVEAQLRYRMKPMRARMDVADDTMELTFEEDIQAATPGQTAVILDGARIIGGGTIEREMPTQYAERMADILAQRQPSIR